MSCVNNCTCNCSNALAPQTPVPAPASSLAPQAPQASAIPVPPIQGTNTTEKTVLKEGEKVRKDTTINSNNDNNSNNSDDTQVKETCVICMEDIDLKTGKNIAKTNCGHTFCLTCLVRALKDNNTCPMCRANIEEEKPKKVNPITFEDCVRLIKDEITCQSFQETADVITMFGNPVSSLKHFTRMFSIGLVKNIIQLQEEGDDYEYVYNEDDFSDEEEEEEEE